MWRIYIVVWTRPLLGKNAFYFIRYVWLPYDLLMAGHPFASHVLMSFSVDGTLFPRLVYLSTSFKERPFSVGIFTLWFLLKQIYPVVSSLTWRPIPHASFYRQCSRDLPIIIQHQENVEPLEIWKFVGKEWFRFLVGKKRKRVWKFRESCYQALEYPVVQ